MHRFFVPSESLARGVVEIGGAVSRQMSEVLRLRKGEHVILLDNSGWEYETELETVSPGRVVGVVLSKRLGAREPRVKLTLYQSLIRTQNFELVLQKCTEIGVSVFVPLVCERSSVGQLGEIGQEKWERWGRIIAEAAEQSGRAKLPVLQPATLFPQACSTVRGLSLVAYEDEREQGLRDCLRSLTAPGKAHLNAGPLRPFSLNLFIGPEGGLSQKEVEIARCYRLYTFGMGPRLLRSETAAIVASSLILYELGDLQPPSQS